MDIERILNKYLRQAVKSSTEEVAEHARTHHGFTARTGMLERSIISLLSQDGLKGWVTIDRTQAPYGPYVHQGTKQHIIVPRRKHALRWVGDVTNAKGESKKAFFFAKRVNHPGFKGDPFLFTALEAKRGYIEKMFDNRVEAAIKEIVAGL